MLGGVVGVVEVAVRVEVGERVSLALLAVADGRTIPILASLSLVFST